MDYGVAGIIGAGSFKTVQRAEQLGFTHAWFYDSPLYTAEIFASMAAAAMVTQRIRLGLGRIGNITALFGGIERCYC